MNKPVPFVVKGPIAVGVLQAKTYVMPSTDSLPQYGPECTGTDGNTAWVNEVDYSDGSTWKAPAGAPVSGVLSTDAFPAPSVAPTH